MKHKIFTKYFILFVVIIIVISGCGRSGKLEKFRKEGIETTATITKVVWKKSGTYSGTDMKKKYNHFEVQYFTQIEKPDSIKNQKFIEKDKNGDIKMNFSKLKPQICEYVRTEIYVSSSQMKKYKKEDKVQVLYLPENEKEAILKEDIKE